MTVALSDLVLVGPSPIHGTGVFARREIATGELIGTYVGAPTDVDGPHVLWIEGDGDAWQGIEGTGDLRWLNHSRAPNVEFDGPDLYAVRDVEAGEELLFDYGDEWVNVF